MSLNVIHITVDNISNKNKKLNEIISLVDNFHNRDLYLLDGRYRFDISSMVMKNNCLISKIDNIRSLIFKDYVYIVNTNLPNNFNVINYKLNNSKFFHLMVLEYIFIQVCESLDNEVNTYFKSITINYDFIKSKNYFNFIKTQSKILNLQYRVEELKNMTFDFLNNKNDLNLLKFNICNNDDVEELIENYNLKFKDISNDVNKLVKEIENMQVLVNINLAKNRNLYAKFSIYLSCFTLCFSIGSFIGSMFGMNLKNDLEKNNYAFKLVFSTSLFIGLFISMLIVLFFNKLK